jgi:hypothetical protein
MKQGAIHEAMSDERGRDPAMPPLRTTIRKNRVRRD